VHTRALTVNMIHVMLTDPVTRANTVDIVVSSAHSDVNFVPAPKRQRVHDRVAGSGDGPRYRHLRVQCGVPGRRGFRQLQYTGPCPKA